MTSAKKHIDNYIKYGLNLDKLNNIIPKWVKYTESERTELLNYAKSKWKKLLKSKQKELRSEVSRMK